MGNYVYILLSEKDNRTYLGSTNDLDRRIKEHMEGKCKATRNRRPLKLIYTESLDSLVEARLRERYYKTAAGRRKLKNIFEQINNNRE